MYAENDFQIRCVAKVINLGVKACMGSMHTRIKKISLLLMWIGDNVKRRDMFHLVEVEMNCWNNLLTLATEKRWSSIFQIIKTA